MKIRKFIKYTLRTKGTIKVILLCLLGSFKLLMGWVYNFLHFQSSFLFNQYSFILLLSVYCENTLLVIPVFSLEDLLQLKMFSNGFYVSNIFFPDFTLFQCFSLFLEDEDLIYFAPIFLRYLLRPIRLFFLEV